MPIETQVKCGDNQLVLLPMTLLKFLAGAAGTEIVSARLRTLKRLVWWLAIRCYELGEAFIKLLKLRCRKESYLLVQLLVVKPQQQFALAQME